MTISGLDTLVLLPLIPLAPLLVTWWLPWERWIPWGKIPKTFMGPYILYAVFAAWYFQLDWWIIGTAAVAGLFLSVLAVVEKIKNHEDAPPSNNQSRQKPNGS